MGVGEQHLRSRSRGFLLGNSRERLPRMVLFLPALYVTAVVTPFLADWRYAVPTLPSLVALSGLALESAIQRRHTI
jgi:hypothetical protein